MDLFVARNRDGNLQLFTSDRIIKNKGRGTWIPEYEAQRTTPVILLGKNGFPEVEWTDDEPTEVELINPLTQYNNEEVSLDGFIELNTMNKESLTNVHNTNTVHVNSSDISFIEAVSRGAYNSIVHMKNGESILCTETVNHIKKLIKNSHECLY